MILKSLITAFLQTPNRSLLNSKLSLNSNFLTNIDQKYQKAKLKGDVTRVSPDYHTNVLLGKVKLSKKYKINKNFIQKLREEPHSDRKNTSSNHLLFDNHDSKLKRIGKRSFNL